MNLGGKYSFYVVNFQVWQILIKQCPTWHPIASLYGVCSETNLAESHLSLC